MDQVQAANESIPARPQLMADNATTDLSNASGAIGMMRNGVVMYGYVWCCTGLNTVV